MEDQRICIKFCVKNGFKGAKIFWMLQTAYGDAVMSRRRVFEWYKRFKAGREETADNERPGRPSTSTTPEKVDMVLELVREDRRTTVREVAEEAGISFGFDFRSKERPERKASLNLEATTDDPELLKRVITGDETWIYGFDSETTQQASEWRFKNEPGPKKARKAPSKVKVMLTVFFDYQGIVHHEFQQQGPTITGDSYLGVLRRLREAIRQKRPELWRSNPDLTPCDFFLFGKLKKKLKGRKFQSIEEIKVESKKAMKAIPKTDYQRCFADWKKRWLKCIAAIGDYFEGENLNLYASGTLNSQRYISELLEPVVLPYLQGLSTAIFQQDNAQPHVARFVQRFIVNRQIELFPWPARSPNLSPIETCGPWLIND
ncbi:hypothetical protein LAZ67_8000672 [Cordylochernes scorpioides]|uniref:Mos1 transposase HTH domain-containing protein n=1 Tax=Cordylochernes scorpioides TaxID=51811 RepID=A0ABY6KPK1_9ARAC|nr:hypothetical protein LAZ67_8000672 [Cordylochernes scorpioides]